MTGRERRNWAILGAALLALIVVLAVLGPLPPSLLLVLNAGALGLAFWSWRTGRFRVDAVPAASREEAARRREWMRTQQNSAKARSLRHHNCDHAWFCVSRRMKRICSSAAC